MSINLNKREKYYVSAAAAFIILFVVIQLIVFPLFDKRKRLKRAVKANMTQLETMRSLSDKFRLVRAQAESAKNKLSGRQPGFSLFAFLDELVGKTNLKDRIAYMKPSTSDGPDSRFKISAVEMKIQGITMKKVVEYLYHVENSGKSAQIKRISISETGKQEGLVDVVLQVETLEAA